jgi:adrenodoxin-NADP+ reductase
VGNVPIGEKRLGVDVLSKYYDAVIFAYGAGKMRRLGIPGEDLQGVYSAGEFVGWYNGLPQHVGKKFPLQGKNVVIIGHGNVALDVARILLTPPELLRKTDITEVALRELEKSKVKSVRIVGRRGVLQASFTVRELRELTTIPGVTLRTAIPDDVLELKSLARIQQRTLQLLKKAPFVSAQEQKSCDIDFLLNPTCINGTGHISSITFEQQHLDSPADGACKPLPTGTHTTLPADILFTAIGYTALPLDGMSSLGIQLIRGIIPNSAGRVLSLTTKDFGLVKPEVAEMERIPGFYVSGWTKTGPTGVIARTMVSAYETADSLVQDWQDGKEFLSPEGEKGWEGLERRVEGEGGRVVGWEEWKRIEGEEEQRGRQRGKEREKIVDVGEMLEVTARATTQNLRGHDIESKIRVGRNR